MRCCTARSSWPCNKCPLRSTPHKADARTGTKRGHLGQRDEECRERLREVLAEIDDVSADDLSGEEEICLEL